MKLLIAGGTGLVGYALVDHHLALGNEVAVLGRSHEKITSLYDGRVKALTWQQLSVGMLAGFDIVINLAGTNIGDKSWSEKRKQDILSSRIDATAQLSELLASLGESAPGLLNASAVGFYGLQTKKQQGLPDKLDETSSSQSENDFVSEVGAKWEQATLPASKAGVRVVLMRFGVVLSKSGGALPKMAMPFKFGLGGVIGSGRQPFSWVALDDVVAAIDYLIANPDVTGAVNVVSPDCVTQAEFSKTLAKVLHRPCLFKIPAFVLKMIFGQMAEELLLSGQHVYPARLLEQGFQFKYPKLEDALKHIYRS